VHGGALLSRRYDAVIVGSGINSLACAAFLSRAGWSVAVLEREDELGGAIRTAELTEPGYLHDVFSAWHPLWVGGPAHAELGDELATHGLEYLNTEFPTATAFPDGSSAFLLRSAEANAAELDRHAQGDGEAWGRVLGEFFPNADLAFGVLGTEFWSKAGLGLGLKAYRRLGRQGAAGFAGRVLSSSRDWLQETFESEKAHGLLATWVQEGGMPIPRGGGAKLVEALTALIRANGGVCETSRDVEKVLVRDGQAVGVRVADGETYEASRAVIANVTPTQLYGRLVDGFEDRAARFRYGRSEMQIHFALSEPPRWEGDARLAKTAIVHLTPGLDGVSRAVNEAERGVLPAEATAVVGQPLTIDPSRGPDGAGLLWIQLQELPWQVKGDAAEQLDVGDGTWTESLRERYADRIQARIAQHIPNLEGSIRKRVVLSPADLQAANVNLHHGDPYSGSLALDQNFLWRPMADSPGHATPVDGLWQIGASTWPGPGLGAGSGTLVAKQLLVPPLRSRAVSRVRGLVRR
jgi:phytoene dehydrogenase-like protein